MERLNSKRIFGIPLFYITTVFAFVAISISFITFYKQFFHKDSKLKARIINANTISYEDRMQLTTMFCNYGETFTSVMDVYVNFSRSETYEAPFFITSRLSNFVNNNPSQYPFIIEPNKLIYNISNFGVDYDSLYRFSLKNAIKDADKQIYTSVYAWVHLKVSDEKGNIYLIHESIGKIELKEKEAIACREDCNYRLLNLLKKKYMQE